MTHLKEVCVWRLDAFRAWTVAALRVIRELRRQFPGPGYLVWRADAAQRLQREGLDASLIVSALVSQPAERILKAD